MQRFLVKILISTAAILICSYIFKNVHVESFFAALSAALFIAALNALFLPLLILLTIPITLLTFGLFLIVLNAFMIWIAGNVISGFEVYGFWAAIWFSLILSFVTMILESLTGYKRKFERKKFPDQDV